MKSAAIRRVSSLVRGREAPARTSFPLISTSGGFPGEKKRSLTFGEVFSIEAKSSGVENGAAPGATAVAATVEGGTTFRGASEGADINLAQLSLVSLFLAPDPERLASESENGSQGEYSGEGSLVVLDI